MDQAEKVDILKELMRQLDEGKNIDAGVQYRMPTTSYVCKDQAKKEWDTFFQGHPQLVGLTSDLPESGSFMTMDDFGTPLLATRDKTGKFRAFLNSCRHRAARVANEPKGKASMFTCPFHHWGYGNTGELISIPNEDHFGAIDKSCNGLIELPATERGGLLWVHPQPDGHLDLDELLGEALAQQIDSFNMQDLRFAGNTTIDKNLNWKLANDTFGETYHFQKLHKDTLGRLYLGNNLHLTEYGRHHRFITANGAIHEMRNLPESEWKLTRATFVLYYLFPNIQLVVNEQSVSLIKIYPDPNDTGHSITQVSFYYSNEAVEQAGNQTIVTREQVYDIESRENTGPNLAASLEVFSSTIADEDYVMGEMQQQSAINGLLKEVVFGKNEPALHHFHNNYREALNQPPLEPIKH
ncbi:MAG: aromatic ring-hydroxylating dioxygenase subunit alpha [Pseudomonadales bacterium]|nr:aromatic ring-hydroxylating dioxygenase subunit alpha [Pseudomonadales bacterium]